MDVIPHPSLVGLFRIQISLLSDEKIIRVLDNGKLEGFGPIFVPSALQTNRMMSASIQ